MRDRLPKIAESDLSRIWEYTTHTWGEAHTESYLNRLVKSC